MSKLPAPPFAIQSPERHITMAPAGSLRGFNITTGRLWLTSDRLVFQPVVFWVFWLAPLVGLVLWLMAKAHRLDLPLSAIATHGRTTFGRNPNVLRLVTRDQREHRFVVDTFEPFATALSLQPAFASKASALSASAT